MVMHAARLQAQQLSDDGIRGAKRPWVAQLNINKKIVFNKAYWTEIEAALAYDVACDEHGKSQFKRSAFNKGGLWLFFFIPRGGL